MPELPEAETVRRVLAEKLAGRRLKRALAGRPTFYRAPRPALLKDLAGRRLAACGRRGKYLRLDFQGRGPIYLHLGMSGRLFLGETRGRVERHCRLILKFEGETLRFIDPRRFGRFGCALPEPMGPEPLEDGFDPAYLRRALRKKKTPVKAALLDQAVVAGLGNIYATEALYLAGIRPGRGAGRLAKRETAALHAAIRRVLAGGIAAGGSTLDDEAFLDPLGRPGRAQNGLAVYGRKRCPKGHVLRATRKPIAGRTSLYCPTCQR